MAGPLRPKPPPHLEINGRWNGTLEKSVLFSLMARPFTPPPLLMARPLRMFFAAFLCKSKQIYKFKALQNI